MLYIYNIQCLSFLRVLWTLKQLWYRKPFCCNVYRLILGYVVKKVKLKVNICYSAPNRLSHHRGAQIHGVHQAASHIPALNLPSRIRYSFTDHLRMSKPRPSSKEQLAHGCYATACGQRASNPDLTIKSRAR